MSLPKMCEKSSRGQSASRRTNQILSPTNSQEQIADKDSSMAQLIEKVKNERAVISTMQDEDRRRRTIIIEKKNGTFGFTLQSYGIHYKKEKEIEMITYVDYVEYDGPAYKAGMREGDVILSINGQDMEKADHKALVNFIKNCDNRMRMVVLFEDCVRKVDLHIRYIQLQRILQSKTAELDMLCLKEYEVLQGKWKSHSLPARKKGNSRFQGDVIDSQQEESLRRPTVSIEDVARIPSQSQILLAYPCLDSGYPCVIQSEDSNECLIGLNKGSAESRPILMKANVESRQNRYLAKGYQQSKGSMSMDAMKGRENPNKSKHFHHHTRHLCNPCIQAINNQDNTSLEAYDLASPCCDPHCVPSTRRKSKHQKHKREQKNNFHECGAFKDEIKFGASEKSLKGQDCGEEVLRLNSNRSQKYLSNLVSQFSLHSCTSSHVSQGAGQNTEISYTTSLSSDTLYWDGNENKTQTKQLSYKTSSCKNHSSCENYQTFQPVKPKSWDNLTTKAFGGYGFGYGYVDTGASNKNHSSTATSSCLNSISNNTVPCKAKSQAKNNGVLNLNQINNKSKSSGRMYSNQIYSNGHRKLDKPTKSNENLLLLKKSNPTLTNSSLSCECLEISTSFTDNNVGHLLPLQTGDIIHCHRDRPNQSEYSKQRRRSLKKAGDISRL